MRAMALILSLALPLQAHANGLECTFTTICSPQTECQIHPGVPFRFDITSGAFSFMAGTRLVSGTPLSHLTSPSFGAIFQSAPDSTILLTVTGEGEAVMTQQDVTPTGVQSVSYFGTCEPGA